MEKPAGENILDTPLPTTDVLIGSPEKDAVSEVCSARSERGALRRAETPSAQATSRSFWASARDCSFFSDWFSICLIRSRVTLNVRPTSSSVRGCSPPEAVAQLEHASFAVAQRFSSASRSASFVRISAARS